MDMPRRGENIYKRKDTRWEGRYIKSYDMTGSVRYGYVYAGTYREVKRKLTEAKTLGTNNAFQSGKRFGIYCDEWLVLRRNRVKESTYVKYDTIINRHIKPVLGNYIPQNLNTLVIERFSYKLLTSCNLSTKSVRDVLTVFRMVLKYVRRETGNEIPDIEIVYPKEEKKQMRVLTLEEQERLVKYLMTDMDNVRFGILLSLFSGMRIGEICALRWQDISDRDKVIHISRTMQRLKNLDDKQSSKTRVMIGEAKSRYSDRVIPMTGSVAALCSCMRREDPKAYILTGEREKYMEPRVLQYRLQKILQECDLNGVHFHTLRHTFATRCIEVGFEIKSLSEILGHSDTKITLDRYVHSSMDLKRLNMEKLSCRELL